MNNFEVSTDSTCDLYAQEIKDLKVHFVPLHYTVEVNGKLNEYTDSFTEYSQYVEYYNMLRRGAVAKTSMNNLNTHIEHFLSIAKQGIKNVLHFTISYALSPTVDVANQAVKVVQETYPDFNCICIECHTTTIGQGMLVLMAAKFRDEGKQLGEVADYLNEVKNKIQHFVIVDDLMFLRRGGRVGSANAIIGSALKIKPILVFTKEGRLESYKKEMGFKKAIKSIIDEFPKYTLNKDYDVVNIVHTDNLEAAQGLAQSLQEKYGVKTRIQIMGPIIGAHVGPNAVAYGFVSNENRPI